MAAQVELDEEGPGRPLPQPAHLGSRGDRGGGDAPSLRQLDDLVHRHLGKELGQPGGEGVEVALAPVQRLLVAAYSVSPVRRGQRSLYRAGPGPRPPAPGRRFERLSPAHRTVLVETFYRGSTLTALACKLGVPPGTVRSRLHYALHALRQHLEDPEAATP